MKPIILGQVISYCPGKEAGQRHQPLVNRRRCGLLDRLLVGLPVAHIAGDNGGWVKGSIVGVVVPLDEMLEAAAVRGNGMHAPPFALQVLHPLLE